MHRLSQIDEVAQTAICEECGLTDVKPRQQRGNTRWRCLNAERNSRTSPDHGLRYDEAHRLKNAVGQCEICAHPERLVVDHDHVTGYLRGVLCHWCNTSLPRVERDINWAENAMRYLRTRGWQW